MDVGRQQETITNHHRTRARNCVWYSVAENAMGTSLDHHRHECCQINSILSTQGRPNLRPTYENICQSFAACMDWLSFIGYSTIAYDLLIRLTLRAGMNGSSLLSIPRQTPKIKQWVSQTKTKNEMKCKPSTMPLASYTYMATTTTPTHTGASQRHTDSEPPAPITVESNLSCIAIYPSEFPKACCPPACPFPYPAAVVV